MENPYTLLLGACRTSERAFRRDYGFAKQTLVDVTAGSYENLSERMILSLGKLCWDHGVIASLTLREAGFSPTLEEAYQEWRVLTRANNRGLFLEAIPHVGTDFESPATRFIRDTAGTATGFSKALCVPPQTVRRWASGVSRNTPLAIEQALRTIAYPRLQTLIAVQEEWVDSHGD